MLSERLFDEDKREQKVVYGEEDQTEYLDEERGYEIQWLVPESNEKEMEPIKLILQKMENLSDSNHHWPKHLVT